MISHTQRQRSCPGFRGVVYSIITAFAFTLLGPMPQARAQVLNLPAPGTMVNLSKSFAPAVLTGIKVNPNNPLEFDFLIQPGDKALAADQKQEEYLKLVKYFMAALTTPEKDMWVNLSPYEAGRIVPQDFGQTETGRDLLAQDYILKQLTASLIHPDKELGKKFWDNVYSRTKQQFGTTEVPVNTFNKVWIVPQKAVVYENGHTAMVVSSHLKVMLEEDYLALAKNQTPTRGHVPQNVSPSTWPTPQPLNTKASQVNHPNASPNINAVGTQVLREIIIPQIEKEVNEGEHFAQLRQIYHAVILSAWFKKRLKESILGKIYVDKAKTNGIALDDPSQNQQIFEQYVKAYKKGVYNFIKEDMDPVTQQMIPRKYFSGGTSFAGADVAVTVVNRLPPSIRRLYERVAETVRVVLGRTARDQGRPETTAFISEDVSARADVTKRMPRLGKTASQIRLELDAVERAIAEAEGQLADQRFLYNHSLYPLDGGLGRSDRPGPRETARTAIDNITGELRRMRVERSRLRDRFKTADEAMISGAGSLWRAAAITIALAVSPGLTNAMPSQSQKAPTAAAAKQAMTPADVFSEYNASILEIQTMINQANQLFEQKKFDESAKRYREAAQKATAERKRFEGLRFPSGIYTKENGVKKPVTAAGLLGQLFTIGQTAQKNAEAAEHNASIGSAGGRAQVPSNDGFAAYQGLVKKTNDLNQRASAAFDKGDHRTATKLFGDVAVEISANSAAVGKQLTGVKGIVDSKGKPMTPADLMGQLSQNGNVARQNQQAALNNWVNNLTSRYNRAGSNRTERTSIMREADEILSNYGPLLSSSLKRQIDALKVAASDQAMTAPAGGADAAMTAQEARGRVLAALARHNLIKDAVFSDDENGYKTAREVGERGIIPRLIQTYQKRSADGDMSDVESAQIISELDGIREEIRRFDEQQKQAMSIEAIRNRYDAVKEQPDSPDMRDRLGQLLEDAKGARVSGRFDVQRRRILVQTIDRRIHSFDVAKGSKTDQAMMADEADRLIGSQLEKLAETMLWGNRFRESFLAATAVGEKIQLLRDAKSENEKQKGRSFGADYVHYRTIVSVIDEAIAIIEARLRIDVSTATAAPDATAADGAMTAREKTGGIDLNDQLGTIEFEGKKVNFPVPQGFEWLLKEPISGFVPRIKEINTGTWNTLPFFSEIRDSQPAASLAQAT
ncbi:MAG: hypothetical protein Q7K71_01035 [Candidatus Omnitrophota bacterium]|nr:hypothetical protein [Candidatus Omnitrophota bacterium]